MQSVLIARATVNIERAHKGLDGDGWWCIRASAQGYVRAGGSFLIAKVARITRFVSRDVLTICKSHNKQGIQVCAPSQMSCYFHFWVRDVSHVPMWLSLCSIPWTRHPFELISIWRRPRESIHGKRLNDVQSVFWRYVTFFANKLASRSFENVLGSYLIIDQHLCVAI